MSSRVLIETNEFQTPITQELKDSMDPEVYGNLIEFIHSVKFVERLTAHDRRRVKDLKKDKKGRRIINIEDPHILEDMEYFIKDRLHFEKYGYYTAAKFSRNPNSEYIKYWDEQQERSLHGYQRKDGEWVPGYLYFYWNFAPILITSEIGEITEGSSKVRSDRVEKFGDVWEIDYFYFHYIEKAEEAGDYAVLLKCRGVGASFKSASMAVRNFFLIQKSKSYVTASFDGYLYEDGLMNKVQDMEAFMQINTAFKKKKITSSLTAYKSGYKDKANNNTPVGYLSEIIGRNTKEPNNVRGKRGKLVIHEEAGSHRRIIDTWRIVDRSLNDRGNVFGLQLAQGCVCAGTNVMLGSGESIPIEEIRIKDSIVGYDGNTTVRQSIKYLKPASLKQCVEVKLYGGGNLQCSIDHPLLQLIYNPSKKEHRATFVEAQNLKKGLRVAVPDMLGKFGDLTMPDARLLGLMVGDGSYGKGITPEVYSDDDYVSSFIVGNYNTSLKSTHTQKNGRKYTAYRVKDFTKTLKALGMQGQTKLNKRFPNNIHLWSKRSTSEFIAGYYDADGNVKYRKDKDVVIVVLTSIVHELLYSMQLLLQKFGIHGSIIKEKRNTKPTKEYKGQQDYIYRLYINNQYDVKLFSENITLLSEHKNVALLRAKTIYKSRDSSKRVTSAYFRKKELNKGNYFEGNNNLNNLRYKIIKSVKFIGEQKVYNLTASDTHTYIANGIITHNTGGDEQSDFIGLTNLFFKPKSYGIYRLINVFDKKSTNQTCGFFMGDYMNRPRSYNSDGVTDVIKNLIHIFEERKSLEIELDDPDEIARRKAESAITPLEAITVMVDNVFPKEAAKECIAELSGDYEERTQGFHYCRLKRIGEKVSLVHSSDYFPIVEYPYMGKQGHRAAITIKKMPVKFKDGDIPSFRYIIGIDTLDDDDTTGSLFALQVMDLWTDDIVAWYLGRHVMIEEDYDIALDLCILYNATANYESNFKGLYAHFKRMKALRYLSDTPSILAEKELIKGKGSRVGNASKGTRATAPINAWGRRLQAAWMRKEHTYYTDKRGIDTVDDIEYLREVSMFDPLGNYDKISAGNMLFIYREDLVRVVEANKFKENVDDDYNTDDFFGPDTPYPSSPIAPVESLSESLDEF